MIEFFYKSSESESVRNNIVAEARTWINVPWVHQGRTRSGIDCAGIPIKVAAALGISLYDTTTYPRRPNSIQFLRHFRKAECRRKQLRDKLPGDILLFKFDSFPCHSAILTLKYGAWHVLHAYALRKKVVEEPLDQLLEHAAEKLTHCLAFPGVGD